jgi:hypothetical protein
MRWASERLARAGLAAAALLVMPSHARADGPAEGTYGRIAGDMTLVGALGGVVAARGPRAEAEVRLRYLESVGAFVSYEDGAVLGSSAEPERVLTAGVEVRPLFLFRWLRGKEGGSPWRDMAIDSLGLELGATFAQPAGTGFASVGGLQLGLGVEVPLLPRSTGPWIGLHGGLRWSDSALESGVIRSVDDRAAFLAITVAWHQEFVAHVVDQGDRAPR